MVPSIGVASTNVPLGERTWRPPRTSWNRRVIEPALLSVNVEDMDSDSRTVVAVFSSSDLQLPVIPLEDLLRHARIMQQPQRIVPCICELIEPALLYAHTQCNRAHNLHVQALARLEEVHHLFLEDLRVFVSAGPHVGCLGLIITPDFQAFFQIGYDLAKLCFCACFLQHNELLAPLCDISSIRGGRIPGQSVLLVLWAVEELGAVGEDGGYSGWRYAVVLEVYEAGLLEAFQDCFGGCLSCGGVIRQKLSKVYKLSRRISEVFKREGVVRVLEYSSHPSRLPILGLCLPLLIV
jgi:hypothetical protein